MITRGYLAVYRGHFQKRILSGSVSKNSYSANAINFDFKAAQYVIFYLLILELMFLFFKNTVK